MLAAGGGGGDARPTGWDVLGFGSDPVPGSPASIRSVAQNWAAAVTTLQAGTLAIGGAESEASDKASWQGDTSATFLTDIGTVKAGYARSATWFARAAKALTAWAAAVEEAQATADRALQTAKHAKVTRDDAEARLNTATQTLGVLLHQPPAGTPAEAHRAETQLTTLQGHVTAAQSDLEDADGVIAHQKTIAQDAKKRYDHAASVAAETLNGIASSIGTAPAIPGTSSITHSASAGTAFGIWHISSSGTAGKYHSQGTTLMYGAGGYATSDANFQLGDGSLSATASATSFLGAEASSSQGWSFTDGILNVGTTATETAMVGLLATAAAGATYKGGKADLSASAIAAAEAKAQVTGDLSLMSGLADVKGTAVAEGGAEANASGKVHLGYDGVSAQAGAGAYAGARAGVQGTVNDGGVEAGAGVGVRAGIGFDASAGASLSLNDVGVKANLGAALGIGGDVSIDLEVHPEDVVKDIGKEADDAGKVLSGAAHDVVTLGGLL